MEDEQFEKFAIGKWFFGFSVFSAFVGTLIGLLFVNIPNGDNAIIGADIVVLLVCVIVSVAFALKKITGIEGIIAVVTAIMVIFILEAVQAPLLSDPIEATTVLLYDMQAMAVFLLFMGFSIDRHLTLALGFIMTLCLFHAMWRMNHPLPQEIIPVVFFDIVCLTLSIYHFRKILSTLGEQITQSRMRHEQERDYEQTLKLQSEKALGDASAAEQRMVFQGRRSEMAEWAIGTFQQVLAPFRNLDGHISSLSSSLGPLAETIHGCKSGLRPTLRRELDTLYQDLRTSIDKLSAESAATGLALSKGGDFKNAEVGTTLELGALAAESYRTAVRDLPDKWNKDLVNHRYNGPQQQQYIQGIAKDLRLALGHIYRNAFEAVLEKATGQSHSTGGWVASILYSEPGYHCLVIEDNGNGIPDFVMEDLFKPFVSTKDPGMGVGLGLHTAHRVIVQEHRGSLEVESQGGKFTRVKIRLPAFVKGLVDPAKP